jgi:hypothetical protein
MRNLKLILVISLWLGSLSIQANAKQDIIETEAVNILAIGQLGNLLETCHVAGTLTEWQHSRRALLDVTGDKLGEVDAGLLQFGSDAWLEGCSLTQFRAPSNTNIDLSAEVKPPQANGSVFTGGIYLSGVLANYLIADGHPMNDTLFDRNEARHSGENLLRNYYSLAEENGYALPLVNGIRTGALGSTSFQFNILLIKSLNGTFDAIIRRKTMSTKFSPVKLDSDIEASGVQWSSIH